MSRILVIEDDASIVRGLVDALRRESYHVLTAADGEEGYHLAAEKRPDLVILDLMLVAEDIWAELPWQNSGSATTARSIELLQAVAPYERRYPFSNYLRGLVYLRLHKGTEAAAEFQKILDHPGANWGRLYPLSYIGLARGTAPALWPFRKTTRLTTIVGKVLRRGEEQFHPDS